MQLPMARLLEKHGRTTRSAFQTFHQIISFQNVHLLGVKDSVRNKEMASVHKCTPATAIAGGKNPPPVYIPTHTCSKNTIGKQDRTCPAAQIVSCSHAMSYSSHIIWIKVPMPTFSIPKDLWKTPKAQQTSLQWDTNGEASCPPWMLDQTMWNLEHKQTHVFRSDGVVTLL